ncbi:gliding motility-associated C-terminal domain-containing protein [Taibaiella helva]|uniref:gliding motility-associated C-terminal domain-containing protein n=1 Tax=Taibaiella helva TaxID=2301235 RepID=UPI000E58BA53|nr:gliding motility-associated C-terminal domain-containing protein [Taibaiella helva]
MRNTLLQLFFIACPFLLPSGSYGQTYYNQRSEYLKANSVWPLFSAGFEPSIGLNFNTTPATTFLLDTIGYEGDEGLASVSDPVTGALLFYSNGSRCWNADHEIMLNGDTLMGNYGPPAGPYAGIGVNSTTQGVCIVPFVKEPGKYYLFSLDGTTSWFYDPQPDTPFLYYSVVDMSLDGGRGGIVPGQKNIALGSNLPLSESMIAIPGDNCDIWLVVHDYIHPVFRAYHITQSGVDPNPVVSTAGTQIQGTGGMGAYFAGGMAVSPDRKIIGITSFASLFGTTTGSTGALLCRFDPGTGIVSDAVQMNQTGMASYTMAFSPDNSKVYLSALLDINLATFTTPCPLLQYNISVFDSAAIAASVITVGTGGVVSGYFKSYHDKIYLKSFAGPELFVINQPNLSGAACDFQPYMYNNPGNYIFGGASLPNDVVYAFPADTTPSRRDTTICLRNNALDNAVLSAAPGYDAYLWDDGSTGATRNITDTGAYWVLCKDDCHSLADTIRVKAGGNISFSLGADTLLCNGGSLSLNATVPGGSYRWQDGSTDPVYRITDSGSYWVTVKAQGCTVSDTISINTLDVRQDLGEDIFFCKGMPIPSNILLSANAPAGSSVFWNTGSHVPSLQVQDTGTYWVTVTDMTCAGSDTIRIAEALCGCQVSMPNAFSPNGDGHNDIFRPVIEQGCTVGNYILNIYNRYGARIYSGNNPAAGWNGNYSNGQSADAGTYMYDLSFSGGTKQIRYHRKGDLTLLR